jgi:signal transduction histidine kinase
MLNSVHAMNTVAYKKIRIDCAIYDNDYIQISFSDNGKGMDKQTLALSTVPFFTTRENGSGVGLSLCRQFVRSHNGRFHITSKPNQGTKVFLHLPRAPHNN